MFPSMYRGCTFWFSFYPIPLLSLSSAICMSTTMVGLFWRDGEHPPPPSLPSPQIPSNPSWCPFSSVWFVSSCPSLLSHLNVYFDVLFSVFHFLARQAFLTFLSCFSWKIRNFWESLCLCYAKKKTLIWFFFCDFSNLFIIFLSKIEFFLCFRIKRWWEQMDSILKLI